MITEVCERVDHCRYMEMAVEMTVRWRRWRQRGAQGGVGGAGSSFPAASIMGERRPLASFLHGFLEPSPMEMGSIGEAKTWLWRLEIRGWRQLPTS